MENKGLNQSTQLENVGTEAGVLLVGVTLEVVGPPLK